MLQRERDAAPVVEHDLALRLPAVQRVADGHDRDRRGQLRPQRGGRVERLDDQAVHPLVAEPPREGQLPLGVAARVHDQGVAVAGEQRPADADREGCCQ